MAKQFKVPSLGEGVETAEVAQLYVKEGDTIKADQAVLELETEKAVADLPCPIAGRIAKILVADGDTIRIGQAIMEIEPSGGEEPEPEAPAGEKEEKPEKGPSPGPPQKEKAALRPAASQQERPEPEPAEAEAEDKTPVAAGPATRRLARQLGVDLRRIDGSARGGRITPEDVVRAHEQRQRRGESAQAPPLPDFSQFGPVERVPMNKIARAAAENLQHAWRLIPHVTQHETADITDLEAARKRHNERSGPNAPKLTLTAIAVKAVVAVLKEFPHVNASLDPETDELILKHYFHIGVAVDTDNGLLVPVVRDVNHKSITEIASELQELASKARDRKLSLEEMRGGTFTVSNLGGIGGTAFTPIVVHPQVAILGIGRSRNEVRMQGGAPVERLIAPLSLSYDHRVINGADGARFVVRLAEVLSTPFEFLFEC